jgi:hypothetical protein
LSSGGKLFLSGFYTEDVQVIEDVCNKNGLKFENKLVEDTKDNKDKDDKFEDIYDDKVHIKNINSDKIIDEEHGKLIDSFLYVNKITIKEVKEKDNEKFNDLYSEKEKKEKAKSASKSSKDSSKKKASGEKSS